MHPNLPNSARATAITRTFCIDAIYVLFVHTY